MGRRLLHGIRASTLRPLTAERAEAYVTLLGEMLDLRRSGVLAPTLEELRERLSDGGEDEAAFLRDLLQLEAWGCLTRELEPQCIRGYRDARRERFRHRLTDDAVALLEWLETRLSRGVVPFRVDADDRLLDVLLRARELVHLASGPMHDDGADARRALHLVRSIDGELDAIARGLVDLHAEMRRFARRTIEPRALERLVAGLEAYVGGCLGSVGERRRDLGDTLAQLWATDSGAAGSGVTGSGVTGSDVTGHVTGDVTGSGVTGSGVTGSGVTGSGVMGSGEPLSLMALDTSEGLAVTELARSLPRWSRFLEDGGELDGHCAQIEAATHDVITTLKERMAALLRRGDRSHELACAIRTLAALDHGCEGALRAWGFGTPTWAPGTGTRLIPPLPRQKTRPRPEEPRPLPTKRAHREVVRESNEARMRRIADWLREAGLMEGPIQLSGQLSGQLSRLAPARRDALRGPEAPAAWMAVARAQHLGRSARLLELGVRIEPRPGVVTLGSEVVGLTSPDCIVRPDSARPARLEPPRLEPPRLGWGSQTLDARGRA